MRVQADSIIPEPGNPLAWDRYAYANNNPLYYTDPSGHNPLLFALAVGVVATAAIGAYIAYDIFTTPAITGPNPPKPTNNDVTGWLVDRLNENSTSTTAQSLEENWANGNIVERAASIKAWVALTKGAGTWDYKPDLIESRIIEQGNSNVVIGGCDTSYQAVANINYGYLASVIGLPSWLAEGGAGAAQVFDHLDNLTDNVGGPGTYYDDPYDNYWIRFGYQLNSATNNRNGELNQRDFIMNLRRYMNTNGNPSEPISPGY
jgi:hypothetical protein